MKTEEERVAEEYKSTLDELKSISKVEINALTMLAEENKEFAIHIAACIENQLKAVPNRRKMPVLYLIDSIYEKVRKSLHKLRMTWNDTGIFPQKKLNAIDERVHEMDPNWPILHKLSSQQRQQQQQPTSQQQHQQKQQQHQQSHSQQNRINPSSNNEITTGIKRANNNNNNNIGQANGRRKRTRLGPQQQQQQHQQQQPPIRNILPIEPPVLIPAPHTFISPNIMHQVAPQDLAQVHPTTIMDPSITIASIDQLHHVPTATYIDPNLIIAAAPPPQAVPNEPQIQGQPPQQQPVPQLICTPYNQTQSQPNNVLESRPAHLTVLDSLYGGDQCSNCSLRFDDKNRYRNHLDWHYRQNLKSDNMLARRKWYYPLDLWVQFREINDDDLQDNNNTDSNVNVSSTPVNDHEEPTAPASTDDEKNICSVCHETFEKFWAEDEEEWRLRNARLYEDERVYHPLCLMDMLQPSVACR